jgi:hypothetical protein
MKKTIPAFLAGVLTTVLVSAVAVSALAISGRMTIEIDPINVQVNGSTFQPKDVNGNDVPVFVYNGTTYAPLRALAEAYGLEVGYDKETNMATVGAPVGASTLSQDETKFEFDYSYEEFVGLWEDGRSESPSGGRIFWSLDDEKTLAWVNGVSSQCLEEYATMLTKENPLDTHSDFALRHGKNAGQIVCTIDLQ